jgi:hypothetical protein
VHPQQERTRKNAHGERIHRSRYSRVAVAAGVVVAAVAVTPLVEPLVDWAMDGDLTPGVWEPSQWLEGALITAVIAGALGAPLTLVTLIAIAVAGGRGAGLRRDRCPSCCGPADLESGHCAACGPLPPRCPDRVSGDGPRVAATTLAAIAVAGAVVLTLSTGISWVTLEREEDAFGVRARAAAASGADSHRETSANGSTLGWNADRGYWSHRD